MKDIPGSSDCELHSQAWGQPVLTATSWAYVIAGIVLILWFSRRQDVARGWAWAFAVGLFFTGLGSIDYHGPALTPQPFTHDGGLSLALLVALGIDLTRIVGNSRFGMAVTICAAAVGVTVMIVNPDLSPLLAGFIAVALLVSEAVIYRRGLRTINWTQYAALGSLLTGVVVFTLSRTGGPLCQPDSLLQGHGLWHLLTATALALWAAGALPATATQQHPSVQTTTHTQEPSQ